MGYIEKRLKQLRDTSINRGTDNKYIAELLLDYIDFKEAFDGEVGDFVTADELADAVFSGNYNDLSNQPDLFSGDYGDLDNKPTIPTNNNQLTNGAGYITNSDIPAIPSNTSDLTNDSGFITSGDIPAIPTNNNELDNGAGYITSSDVPTNTSDLNNDSGFITDSSLPDVSGVSSIADPTTATVEDVANKINELITALQS